ncbi:hypothetical protein H9L10_14735 [Phycicoccus endophyticus]|uniref:Uncharacterized protein n=1 Tax=Phycicoccus endophyticus TaxID=1690220 RepID=A0A7G9R1E5_9MICO|nr:hypothetical protein [Phycicoccus endophyticus]NHI18794.1 hypothetical protein [Phycicoccus endophyticus]QNN49420.1 hypothetical protein H9L10_14735 [Phycicoccus endophyticus]GGL36516.1 hypothetical protein GCM10012283_18650 [Phycicoccus endophyticus]
MSGEQHGVVFPVVDGRRSTSTTGRAVVAEALRPVDPVGAAAAARETSWRTGYLTHFRRLVEAGLTSYADARTIAESGLAAVHEQLRWRADDGEEHPLVAAVAGAPGGPTELLDTVALAGGAEPDTALTVPYRGRRLAGDDLRRQLDAWVEAGVVEPGLREVVGTVLENPGWLRLEGRTVVVLGAAAEMGPLRSLLRWGASVAAVDLPRPELWRRLLEDTRGLSGRLLVPARAGRGDLAHRAGIDVLHDLPDATAWVTGLPDRLVLGSYVYADGATHVRVSAAVDALCEAVRAQRSDTALSFLATPTDVFAVPAEAVEAATAAYASRRTSRLLRVPLRTVSGGRLLRRNYVPGEDPGINDSVVLQQGPNYLLAKRIQRWRATAARASGATVSLTVAPPTRTRSVLRNRALAAAYSGAHRFGVEVFEPGTANTLMAAVLVHDLMARRPAQDHPWQDEAYAAAHGGLWRCAYDPRSALGLAALLGVASPR